MSIWRCARCRSIFTGSVSTCVKCTPGVALPPPAPQLTMATASPANYYPTAATASPAHYYPTAHTSTSVVEPEPIPEGWVPLGGWALPRRGVAEFSFADLARAALLHAGIEIPARYLSRSARYIVPRWAVDAMTAWLTSRTDMGWPEFVKAWVAGLGPDVPGKPGEENDDDD